MFHFAPFMTLEWFGQVIAVTIFTQCLGALLWPAKPEKPD